MLDLGKAWSVIVVDFVSMVANKICCANLKSNHICRSLSFSFKEVLDLDKLYAHMMRALNLIALYIKLSSGFSCKF